ncbi:hypothetical protein [Thermodesulfobacterium commune]|uniref:Uncharacterized protein n=1 Tax=Thermodesulfobacterium commune DSM 2178 TaxID=289377 RepID=A0A075WQ60_9BACT|nr:hypothetical protein [Thermodesulfobacterium commune]AIH03479.1 hypothetical protein HL41_00780 [Thermodesulfobacterium commune DSM 2178]
MNSSQKIEIIVGFSTHRIEVLPFAKDFMESAEVIILEEPPNEKFCSVLEGKISEEDYVLNEEFWFPEFEKQTLKLLKNFHQQGKKIFQIEPYLEGVKILQQRAEGIVSHQSIDEVLLERIAETEKNAIGKLLRFYEVSLTGDFEKIVDSVKDFSKADAERFRLRDQLRVEAILKVLLSLKQGLKKVYVEAGTIHLYFKKLLQLNTLSLGKVSQFFLLQKVLKSLVGKPYVFPPGELLTLRYIFNRKENPKTENLLAARSLVYIKIIPKEELLPHEENPFPHLKEELHAIKLIERLDFEDCKRLYSKLFWIKDYKEARKLVEDYLKFR